MISIILTRSWPYVAISSLALLPGLAGCVESYMPDVVAAPNSYLVVDGFINGNGRTRVKLSRSLNIASANAAPVVRGAVLFIADDAGQRHSLRETAVYGSYISDSLQLPPGRQYQLRLALGTSPSSPAYASQLVPLKITPDFDQLELARQGGRVQVLASTHDPSGNSRFYRWRTSETWEFNPPYKSVLEVIKGYVRPRVTPIYTCYRSEQPSGILQASTASLSQDVVRQQPVLSFSDRAERVKVRYSVLVTQTAETAEEFAYYEVLRKNTEAVGTVNDPLPSQLTGNVHRVDDAAEPVLGFVSAHTVVQRRLFATPASLGLPKAWEFEDPYSSCVLGFELVPDPNDKKPIFPPDTRIFKSGENIPTEYYFNGRDTLGYQGARRECVDCRTRGTTAKPSFW